jgi:1-deoxy-D-xylulose-5-phosphate synthase
VAQFLFSEGLLDGNVKFRSMMLPDRFIEHGTQAEQLMEAGLSADHIVNTALSLLGRPKSVGIIAYN